MVTMIDSAEKDLLRKPLGFFFLNSAQKCWMCNSRFTKGASGFYICCVEQRERERNACVQRKRAVSPILLVICHNNPEL
jgi:hypothetical protein